MSKRELGARCSANNLTFDVVIYKTILIFLFFCVCCLWVHTQQKGKIVDSELDIHAKSSAMHQSSQLEG
jgi:hypothetical protein